MGKKYLLYIHSEAFADESKKSDLVNTLLAAHYGPVKTLDVGSGVGQTAVEKPKEAPPVGWGNDKVHCPHGFNLIMSKCKYGCKKGGKNEV